MSKRKSFARGVEQKSFNLEVAFQMLFSLSLVSGTVITILCNVRAEKLMEQVKFGVKDSNCCGSDCYANHLMTIILSPDISADNDRHRFAILESVNLPFNSRETSFSLLVNLQAAWLAYGRLKGKVLVLLRFASSLRFFFSTDTRQAGTETFQRNSRARER